MSSSGEARKGPGCLFWGCLTVGILALGVGGCTAFVLYSAREALLSLTVEEPAPIPVADPAPGQVDQIRQRIEDFQESDQVNELVLTEEDINALIADNPVIAGKTFVNIDEDQLSAQGSVPLEGIPFFSGRYLNGSFSIALSVENDQLLASITDFDFAGQELPDEVKQQVLADWQDINIFELLSDPQNDQPPLQELQDLLQDVDRLEVMEGQLSLIRE